LKRLAVLMLGVCLGTLCAAAETPGFIGRVVVEWLDDDPFVPKIALVEAFAFSDAGGRRWIAEKGQVLDGRSIPLLFRDLVGPPFGGDYRKSTVVYESQCYAMDASWRDVHRLFYDASRAEGVPELDAKLMYMALYAAGLRWEPRGSSCFRGCHASAESLSWKPLTAAEEVAPVVQWIRQTNPRLEQIDRKLDAAIMKPGPHIFVQGHSRPIVADPLTPERDAGGSSQLQRKE